MSFGLTYGGKCGNVTKFQSSADLHCIKDKLIGNAISEYLKKATKLLC